ncbi:MAG: histidine kinase [Saprospiraceae bacterium]|nr:histidine kinase [Saprospiraceae bacterium]
MPIIDVLTNYIMFDDDLFRNINIWLVSFPIIYVLGALSWYGHVLIGNSIRSRYPLLHQTKLRILILALCIIPFMSFTVCVIFLIYDTLHILDYNLSLSDLKMGLLVGFSVNAIFESLYEADFTLERYKQSLLEKQYLQQLIASQEFDALKKQVNPHFLFNCFNTLSSLISIDRVQASEFLDELSKVYRYLLRNNEESLSTVENEVRFIESYAQLLKTRHGTAIELNIDIDPGYATYLIPSLSLQLLVENAVKHNVLDKGQPLVIDIFSTAGNRLIVNNNLQRRKDDVASNGVGIANIKSKYSLLGQDGFQVMEDAMNFTVVLPLIWNHGSNVVDFTANGLQKIHRS